jgi:hypothetical protein
MKFEFELDGIDTEALYDMINKKRLSYLFHIGTRLGDDPVSHARISHLIGLVHNVDDIENTVFKSNTHTDLSYLGEFNTVDFPDD